MKQKSGLRVQGFARVKILENGKVVGDSKKVGPNRVTTKGLQEYIALAIMTSGSPKYIAYAQLGTGTAPASNSTRLHGSIGDAAASYDAIAKSTATASDGATLRWYGTFGSADSFITDTDGYTIQNIGLMDTNNTNAVLAAGQTYATSDCQSNQDVQYTYEWQIDTTA
jgi:hypothetical protein